MYKTKIIGALVVCVICVGIIFTIKNQEKINYTATPQVEAPKQVIQKDILFLPSVVSDI